jgi:hypothetical protein
VKRLGLKWLLLQWLLLIGLAGCAGPEADTATTLPPPSRPPRATPRPLRAEPVPSSGFTALSSPQQVVGSIPVGRADPFAPVAPAAVVAAGQAPVPLPEGFRFSGVIRSGGQVQALVQVGSQSGPLCPGPRGACGGSGLAPLLPPGWSVAAIDAAQGRLTLRQGRQQRVLTLNTPL